MPDGIQVGVGVKDKAYNDGLERIEKRGEKFATRSKKFFSGLAKGIGAATLGGAGLVAVFQRVTEKYDDIAKSSGKAGIDPETFQRQAHAFSEAGIEMRDYTNAVIRMGRKTVEASQGNKALQKAFADLNVDLDTFAKLSPDEQILALADAYKDADDKQTAFAALFKILEDDAKKFKLAFEGGAAAIRDAGDELDNLLDEDELKTLEEARDTVALFAKNLANLSVKKLAEVLKYFAGIAGHVETLVRGLKGLDFGLTDEEAATATRTFDRANAFRAIETSAPPAAPVATLPATPAGSATADRIVSTSEEQTTLLNDAVSELRQITRDIDDFKTGSLGVDTP